MRGPLAVLVVVSIAAAFVILVMVGPRRIDADVVAALVIGTLLGGALDQILPVLVRAANRAMRVWPRDDGQ